MPDKEKDRSHLRLVPKDEIIESPVPRPPSAELTVGLTRADFYDRLRNNLDDPLVLSGSEALTAAADESRETFFAYLSKNRDPEDVQ